MNQEVVHTGSTPVRAIGVVDQHSQLQLYMEGTYDKVITFCSIERFNKHVSITNKNEIEGELSYLKGHSLNDVMRAEFEGTRLALTEQKRPNCTITLKELSAFTLGQLFYLFELQTAYGGKFYNVNAFAMLGRKGFEQRKKEIDVLLQRGQKMYCI